MTNFRKIIKIKPKIDINTIITTLTILILITRNTYAYIDPGSGSMILQVIIAAVLGTITVIKIYWNKVKSIFSRKSDNKKAED